MNYPYNSVSECIFDVSERFPDKAALVYNDEAISYGLLKERAKKAASYFKSLGIKEKSAVVYALRAVPEFFYMYLAASETGAVCVGAPLRCPPETASAVVNEMKPNLIICDDAVVEIYRNAASGTDTAVLSCAQFDEQINSINDIGTEQYGAERLDMPLFVLYTSGTTKKPKGAIMTHRNVIASTFMQDGNFEMSKDFPVADTIQHFFPVNHVSGCIESGVAPLVEGGTIVLEQGFNPQKILEDTQKYGITLMCGVPAMWTKILEIAENVRFDLSSVRHCVSGGALLPGDMIARINKTICKRLENPLGMTETAGFCTYFPDTDEAAEKHTSVGKVIPGLSYRIIDDEGKPVSQGEIGQICYKGDSVIPGYINAPLNLDGDGYLLSGDMAYEDAEGYIYLCGRSDDMFTVGGYNVFPQEIEDVLMCYPGVTGAAVLPIPHHSMGNVPRAYITVSREVRKDEIVQFASERLIHYKVPKNIEIVDAFPMTPLGKIAKKVIAEGIKQEFSK